MASTTGQSSTTTVSLDHGFLLTEGTDSINCTPIPSVNDSHADTTKKTSEEKEEKDHDEQTGENDIVYIEPQQNPYVTAVNYLEEHHIMQIFQHLTAGIVYQKPEDPLQYMVDELVRMKAKKLDGVRFPGS